MITGESYDCQMPANLDDSDMDIESGSIGTPKPDIIFTETSLQRALMQTMPQRCRVAQLMNDFNVEQSFSETLELGSKLSENLHQISEQLRSCQSDSRPTSCGMAMYRLMTYRFLVNIHQTYATRAFSDPVFYFSRKVCLDTCLLIASDTFAPSHSADIGSDYRRVVETTSGTPKNVIMLAFLYISLELVKQLEGCQRSPVSVADNLLRQEIFRVLDAYSELTLTRITMGETNIKGYVFSVCGVSKLRLLEKGENSETGTVDSAVRSLHHGISLLKERLDGVNTANTDVLPTSSQQQYVDFDLPFGDDLGWDDWDPEFNLESVELFFPQS